MILPLALALSASASPWCGTERHLPPGPVSRDVGPVAPPGSGKELRDAFGEFETLTSTNFAVKWGPDSSGEGASELLDDLEHAWRIEIEDMGHAQPSGTERWLLNVYVGNSGGGAPSIDVSGELGYFTLDGEGQPYIVMAPGVMGQDRTREATSCHELYHATQEASGHPWTAGYWYWEATATWVEGEVWPESSEYAGSLYGYAMLPHLSLAYVGSGGPNPLGYERLHPYGAFIFPRFLSEEVADWELVRDSWVLLQWEEDPLYALDELLAEHGTTGAEAFGQMAAHDVVWDYADGDVYARVMDHADDRYVSLEVAAWVSTGGADWTEAPDDRLPHAWGYNLVGSHPLGMGRAVIGFEGDPEGSSGTVSTWGVAVVRDTPDGPVYVDVELIDGSGGAWIDDLGAYGGEERVYLVVTATAPVDDITETFGWRYRFDIELDEDAVAEATPEDPGGCGCGGGAGSGALWLLPVVAARRRRSIENNLGCN